MSKPTVLLTMSGQNSRFTPFNNRTHKGAIALCGKPLLFRTLEKLSKHNYRKIVVVLNPRDNKPEGLRGILPEAFPELHLEFVVQEKATGMGDAILLAKKYLSNQFILSGGYHDQLADVSDDMLALEEPLVVTATTTDRPWEYGILETVKGYATSITEKPAKGSESSNLKIQTMYLLNLDFVELLENEDKDQYSFETALNKMMKRQPVAMYETDNLPTLKYAWHLFDFQDYYFNQLKSSKHGTVKIASSAVLDESHGPIYIGANSVIGHAVKLVGPCFIGKEVLIGDYSFVRHSSIEMGATIGANTEIARSIIMENSSVHYSYLADSIIGQGVHIGAGLITANKRLDRRSVPVMIKGEKVDTGRPALGVLVGDGAQLGIRVSTMPGVVIGHLATVFPGSIIYNNVAPETIIKSKE